MHFILYVFYKHLYVFSSFPRVWNTINNINGFLLQFWKHMYMKWSLPNYFCYCTSLSLKLLCILPLWTLLLVCLSVGFWGFFGHLSFLVVSELPVSVGWCLTLIWGKFLVIIFQIFLLFLSFFFSPSGIPVMCMLHLL